MSQAISDDTRADAGVIAALAEANLQPLWVHYQRLTPMAPQAKDESLIWRWRDVEPLTAQAAAGVSLEDAERRAIIMSNPGQ